MTDPRKFKAPYNPKQRIWREADRLRAAHPAGRSFPPTRQVLLHCRLMSGIKDNFPKVQGRPAVSRCLRHRYLPPRLGDFRVPRLAGL